MRLHAQSGHMTRLRGVGVHGRGGGSSKPSMYLTRRPRHVKHAARRSPLRAWTCCGKNATAKWMARLGGCGGKACPRLLDGKTAVVRRRQRDQLLALASVDVGALIDEVQPESWNGPT